MGERLHRELQRAPARRTPRRRDLLHAQRGQDHRGKLAAALQHRASAWIARLQAAGTRGLHPGIRAGGPATPTSNAARAGAATIIALTIKLDPSVAADQGYLIDVRRASHGEALCIVEPAATGEVSAVVKACAARGIPITPIGGNTGLVGGAAVRGTTAADGTAVPGIGLSLRRMNRIREISAL